MATVMKFAMGAAVRLREDYDAGQLRQLAKRSDDADQTRRLLSLATIYDGGSRTEAARIGGVGLHNGIRFSIWASAVMIVVAELVIGVRSEQHGRELAISAGLGVVFGLLVISLRLILH